MFNTICNIYNIYDKGNIYNIDYTYNKCNKQHFDKHDEVNKMIRLLTSIIEKRVRRK